MCEPYTPLSSVPLHLRLSAQTTNRTEGSDQHFRQLTSHMEQLDLRGLPTAVLPLVSHSRPGLDGSRTGTCSHSQSSAMSKHKAEEARLHNKESWRLTCLVVLSRLCSSRPPGHAAASASPASCPVERGCPPYSWPTTTALGSPCPQRYQIIDTSHDQGPLNRPE